MIRYVPTSSAEVAEAMSQSLWHLSRPAKVAAQEGTVRLFPWLTDTAGHVWLQVQTEYVIPVHAEAVIDGIEPILLGAGISQVEVDGLAALIISLRGQTMTPWQYFPQVFQDASKDYIEMIAAGLLAEPTSP